MMTRENYSVTAAYLFLALCGLAIPLAHHHWATQLYQSTRYASGSHPGPFLFFFVVGRVAWFLPAPAFIAALLSLRFDLVRSFQGVFVISIAMLVCASLYAVNCVFLIYLIIESPLV